MAERRFIEHTKVPYNGGIHNIAILWREIVIYLFISAKASHDHRQAAQNLMLSKMLIQALIQARNPTHCLIVGDLNYNTIDWNLCLSKRDADEASRKWNILETLKDLYLYQHCRDRESTPAFRRASAQQMSCHNTRAMFR